MQDGSMGFPGCQEKSQKFVELSKKDWGGKFSEIHRESKQSR
jgi:hypothetical protein